MKEPNFILAGGVCSGTSFLAFSTKDHPQIYFPKIMRPECGFFYKSWEYKNGKDYYLKKWFSDVKDETAIGERSALYLHGTFNNVSKRIHDMYPNIKLIFCLRNPTERAYANYRFTALCGYESLSFKDALRDEEKRSRNEKGILKEVQPHLYKKRGCYYEQLVPYFELFPKKQILCIKSEVMAGNPEDIFKQIFKFLDVDLTYRPLPQVDFTSPEVKNLLFQTWLKKLFGYNLDLMTENFRMLSTKSLLDKIIGLNLKGSKKQMNKEEREMLNEYYAPHNEKLEKLLGWDLSDWR